MPHASHDPPRSLRVCLGLSPGAIACQAAPAGAVDEATQTGGPAPTGGDQAETTASGEGESPPPPGESGLVDSTTTGFRPG